jgi:hypothetical protein
MALGGWPRLPKGIPDDAAFSVQVLNVTPVVLSFVIVIFAVVTQLLAATGAISLSTIQQLTMGLAALGLIVLLTIAYMACHAYLAARARLEARLDRRPASATRINRDGRAEPADEAEQARAAAQEAEARLAALRWGGVAGESGKDTGTREDSSWRITALTLFGVTAVLAGLAILGDTHTSTSSHLSTTDIFTDLAGAGSLIGGVATMLVFLTGYWDRRKRKKQQANAEVLNNSIEHIGHPLQPEDIRALADLARALNGKQDDTQSIEAAARTKEQPVIGPSTGSATTAADGRET